MARKPARKPKPDHEIPPPVGEPIGIDIGDMLGIRISVDLAAASPMIVMVGKLHALEKDLRAGGLLDYADRLKAAITEWEMTK